MLSKEATIMSCKGKRTKIASKMDQKVWGLYLVITKNARSKKNNAQERGKIIHSGMSCICDQPAIKYGSGKSMLIYYFN